MTKCCLFSRYINDVQPELASKMNPKVCCWVHHRCLQFTVFLTSEAIPVT